jgi:PAS domain S-box-containing protein
MQWADVFPVISSAAFVVVAGLAVLDAARHRDRARARLAAALSLLAAGSVASRVGDLIGQYAGLPQTIATLTFAASAYALVAYRAEILPLRRWIRALTAFACSATGLLVVAFPPPESPGVDPTALQWVAVLSLVGVWIACVVESAGRFVLASKSRPPVQRARLRFIAASYLGIVVVLAGLLAARPFLVNNPTAGAHIAQSFSVVLIAMLYMGVAPPRAVRRWWLRRAAASEAKALLPVGSWYWDLAADHIYWSPELIELLGIDEDTVTPTFLGALECVHPQDRDVIPQLVAQIMTERTTKAMELRVSSADGMVTWVEVRGQVVADPATDEVVALFGTTQDITDRKRTELALRAALQRERDASERLRSLDEMKDSLLAAVSHELRTPLTVVLGLSETLRRQELLGDSPRAVALIDRLEANAKRLERLLLDLLDLDRLGRGVIEPRRTLVDLDGLFARVIHPLDATHHRVHVQSSGLVANVDPAHVERIVENLVINATRHTPSGSSIWVRAERLPGAALVVVEDDGPGVPGELQESIFEIFQQGARSAGGTGVGLSLVRKFAELHGGRAWVEDTPAGGASFRVLLPDEPGDGLEILAAERGHKFSSGSDTRAFILDRS